MVQHKTETETTSLGDYLRQTRLSKGLELTDIAEETRITPHTLRAMEGDDYGALPAEAFTRGFYSLYAKSLDLDQEEVLARYGEEIMHQPAKRNNLIPPQKLGQNIGSMAERPTSVPMSYFGLILFLFLIVGAILCWYFSWNPASYLSEKLRSLQQPSASEMPLETKWRTPPESDLEIVTISEPKRADQMDAPPSTDQKITFIAEPKNSSETSELQLTSGPLRYFVTAEFAENTKVGVEIDDQSRRVLNFSTGERTSWQARKKIVLTLPTATSTRITLNDVPIDLPQSEDDLVTISIPEFLLH